jgi:hypothetical protein
MSPDRLLPTTPAQLGLHPDCRGRHTVAAVVRGAVEAKSSRTRADVKVLALLTLRRKQAQPLPERPRVPQAKRRRM